MQIDVETAFFINNSNKINIGNDTFYNVLIKQIDRRKIQFFMHQNRKILWISVKVFNMLVICSFNFMFPKTFQFHIKCESKDKLKSSKLFPTTHKIISDILQHREGISLNHKSNFNSQFTGLVTCYNLLHNLMQNSFLKLEMRSKNNLKSLKVAK